MPRDAFISIYELGGLEGLCRGMSDVSTVCLGRPFNGKFVFYSSLFQAGIDRIIVDEGVPQNVRQEIPQRRLHISDSSDWILVYDSVKDYFNAYLEAGWMTRPEKMEISRLLYFLTDLLTSFRMGRPLLTTLELPDLGALEIALPGEILLPAKRLFQNIKAYDTVVALPTLHIAKDKLDIFDEIIASSAYGNVEEQHRELLVKPSVTSTRIAQLEKANKALYWKWKDFLRMKSSLVRVARNIPDVLEALFGKAKSSVAKPFVEELTERLSKDNALLIYDTSPLLTETLASLILQVHGSQDVDSEALRRRIQKLQKLVVKKDKNA